VWPSDMIASMIIMVASFNGEVGKSTTALHLAACVATTAPEAGRALSVSVDNNS
jgi:cellulose biosynthesis protein BcsQ